MTTTFDPIAAGATPVAPTVGAFDPLKQGATPVSAPAGGAIFNAAKEGLQSGWNDGVSQTFNPEKIGKIVTDAYTNAINDAASKLTDLVFSWKNDPTKVGTSAVGSTLQNVVNTGEIGIGVANALLSPITSTFKAAEAVPVIGFVAKGINSVFSAVGNGTGELGVQALNSLPLSADTKNRLAPLVREAAALAGQIALGKYGEEGLFGKSPETNGGLNIGGEGGINVGGKTSGGVTGLIPTLASHVTTILNGIRDDADIATPIKQSIIEAAKGGAKTYGVANEGGYNPDRFGGIFQRNRGLGNEPTFTEPLKPAVPIDRAQFDPIKEGAIPVSQTDKAPIVSELPVKSPISPSDIEKVTPKSIEGTGATQTRGLAAGVEAKAVENKLTTGFGDLPEYRTMDIKDQAEKAANLVNGDYETAKKVAMGEKSSPQGLHPEAVYTAVELRATKEGDVNLLRDLATRSTLVTEATTMGQRIKLLDERNPESPVKAIRDIQKAREARVQKLVKDVSRTKKDIASEISDEIKKVKPTKQTWGEFVRSIQC